MANDFTESEQSLVADQEVIDLARKLEEARSNQKQWGDLIDYYRDQLLEKAKELREAQGFEEGVATKTVIASGATKVVTISESIRKIFDREAFHAAHPEIDLDQYQKVSSSVTVRVGRI